MTKDFEHNSSTKLDDLIAEYVIAEENGEVVNRDVFLQENAEFTDELKAFFDDRDRFRRLAQPLEKSLSRMGDLPASIRYFGDYELLEEIAQGGMGVVYLGRQVSLDRVVAVKMIISGHLASRDEKQRFVHEAKTAATLKHRFIVPIYEVGEQEGQLYYSMEYIDGEDLAKTIRKSVPSYRNAVSIVKEIAEAVAYAHKQGVVHRDLKPSNIMITADGEVRITDFGLALRGASNDELTRSGQVMGTPGYLSPEQAQAKRDLVGPASDIYSMGVILYELLVGRPPFRGETPVETIQQTISDEPISPSRLDRRIPRDLETICLKCLEKEPHRRYGTASLLVDDIRRYLSGEPIKARPVLRVERLWKWARRKPATALSIVTINLALCALLVGLAISNVLIGTALRDKSAAYSKLEAVTKDLARQEGETRRALEIEQVTSYLRSIVLADREWSLNHIDRSEQSLDDCPRRLRGWEWRYLRHRNQSTSRVINLDTNPNGVDISPDGKFVAVSTGNIVGSRVGPGGVRVVDILSGREVFAFEKHEKPVFHAMYSPDGRWIASSSNDKKLFVWDASTGEVIHDFERDRSEGYPIGLAFHPQGDRMAFGLGRTKLGIIEVRDLDSGDLLQTFEGLEDYVISVVYNFDGTRLASLTFGGNVQIWDTQTGEKLAAWTGASSSLAYSPDGSLVASIEQANTSDANGRVADQPVLVDVVLRSADNGEIVRVLKTEAKSLYRLSFGSDGNALAAVGSSGSAGYFAMWEVSTGDLLNSYRGLPTTTIGIDVDLSFALTASVDGELKIWQLNRDRNGCTSIDHRRLNSHGDVAFSPGGKELVSLSEYELRVWDVETGRQLSASEGVANTGRSQLSTIGQEQVVVVATTGVTKWEPESNDLAQVMPHSYQPWRTCACVNESGTILVTAHNGSSLSRGESRAVKIQFYDADSGVLLREFELESDLVTGLRLTDDDKTLIVAADDASLSLVDAATGETRASIAAHRNEGGYGRISNLVQDSQRTRLATTGLDGEIKIWDTSDLTEIACLKGHVGSVYGFAFSPDGTRYASCGRDQTIRIWDSSSGDEILSLMGHNEGVVNVAFSPDSSMLASISSRGAVKIWHAPFADR